MRPDLALGVRRLKVGSEKYRIELTSPTRNKFRRILGEVDTVKYGRHWRDQPDRAGNRDDDVTEVHNITRYLSLYLWLWRRITLHGSATGSGQLRNLT